MNSILIYLLQVSLVFGSFYLLYKWLFSKFTFHAVNRTFLLLVFPLALLLPFSNLLFPQIQNLTIEIPLLENFTAFSGFEYFTEETVTLNNQTVNYGFWMFFAYAIGVLCYLVRFIKTTLSLVTLKRNSQKISSNNTTLYKANVSEIFSYFHWIFVPNSQKEAVDELIITHEKAHVQHLHSIDVVLAELFIAFFWFHPLAYSYRKSLKSIHEFQADAFVLKQHVKKSTYLELLLKSLEPKNTNPVYSYFSHPTLKKRIEMITKSQSKHSSKLLYLLLIPVIALVFMAFTSGNESMISNEFIPITIKTNGKPSLFPVKNGSSIDITSHFGLKPNHPRMKNAIPHGGIDIKAINGTPVIATADGIVIKATKKGNWGNLLVISHADGFETWYAHLKGFNIKEGTKVTKGDIVGYVGNTGLSTGSHLHYEVRQDGKRLDPMNYITE
ncbi:Murein DD-endopeptidase MepM [Kordia antarctica]|uniref:Murein DD-endopeptidase MepM n=1 Tax=Kordia antarctica TaxID=1218801 RepID=A0A7L4ZEP6_9FLAO|nr:M23/M56 family metallopeptidase [Kordia antarctica]QHI35095.1 Murein DD-endopeptidase MepM [Kordia antarctica]